MEINLNEISVRELIQNYSDEGDDGVYGYKGLLDIRPPYQREFIYKEKQRERVIDTVIKRFPLNVMYWAVRDNDTYEVIDGQQRTISICQFVNGDFSYNGRYFHNLQKDEQEQILDYSLMVYFCKGTDSEKLDWFSVINIAGEKLTDQELRNAVFTGSWVSDAKRYFSKNQCPAYQLGSDYLNGASIRQEYLETTISWISNGSIQNYMGIHQHDPNANELWLYFQSVINWVKVIFPKYKREMKGVNWGFLYNEFNHVSFDSIQLETKVTKLMMDDDVTNKKGIYEFLLTGKERFLSIRAFTDNQKRECFEKQGGICIMCNGSFEISEMEADHITPWSLGGKTSIENCQMLCKEDNRRKSAI
jgi:hypothetical protein